MSDKVFKIGSNQLVRVTIWLNYIIGMWPKNDSTIIYRSLGFLYQSATTFAWTLAKCIGTFFLADKNEIIMFTASSMYCIVAAYRAFIIMIRYKAIDVCLNSISEFSLSKVEYEIIQPKIKSFSKLSSTYTAFILSGLVSAFLNPVLSAEGVMPVPIWLPYLNWKENERDFYIGLIFSALGISSMVVVCAFTPIIIWYVLYGSSLALEVLGHRLQNVGYEQENQEQTLADLIKCIRIHQDIVENIKKIEETFSSVFLLQITSSALCICSVAYLMASESISENFNNFAMYFSLGGIYAFEIFVVIYFANDISLASDRLSYSIYKSNWPCMSMKCRKIVLIIGEKWRKPKQLVVGKIFVMRINLLTSILNLAYSILNVLRKE